MPGIPVSRVVSYLVDLEERNTYRGELTHHWKAILHGHHHLHLVEATGKVHREAVHPESKSSSGLELCVVALGVFFILFAVFCLFRVFGRVTLPLGGRSVGCCFFGGSLGGVFGGLSSSQLPVVMASSI